MDDTGWRNRSHEPPPLAPVRQLRLGDFEGSTAAGEEWYETERLSGQITGGVASEPPVDRQAPGHDQPVLLDWRHVHHGDVVRGERRLLARARRGRQRCGRPNARPWPSRTEPGSQTIRAAIRASPASGCGHEHRDRLKARSLTVAAVNDRCGGR